MAPGFIDLHSHSGLWLLHEALHEPKVRQGVTTEVIGVDGLSYAPFTRAEDLAAQVVMNAGLDGRPEVTLDWDTVASYLGRFDGQVAVNVAMLIGNSALRICAIGWDDVPSDDRTRPTCGPCSAKAWRRAHSGSRPGWTIRPARTPPPRSWRT